MSSFCDISNFSSGFLTGFWASFAQFYLLMFLVSISICGLVAYCFKAFGIYKMAQGRNLNNAYLAWIPFARHYLFGKISDDINRYKNIKSSNRVILLVLSILNSVSVLMLYIFVFVSLAELLGAANYAPSSSDYWAAFISKKISLFLIILTIMSIAKLMFIIFYCIYANNIFKDYVPKLSGLMCFILILNYFVFSGIFSYMLVDSVIFLSICTNQPNSLKDRHEFVE